MSAKTYRTVPVRNLSSDELLELSKSRSFPCPVKTWKSSSRFSGKSTATPLTWNWK